VVKAWRARLERGAELAAAAMFAAMFGAFMIQIVSRYVFNHPVSWSLEVCSIAYIWAVFWTCNLLISERQHIVFDVIYKVLPPHWRRGVAVLNTGTLAAIFIAGLPATLGYIAFMGRRKTMILHVPLDVTYACFGVFMIAVIVGALLRLRRLLGGAWRQHL
jgi:TRAP-type C4-dicarboxylate transport system permease small subunit